jgi:hypothetical protein
MLHLGVQMWLQGHKEKANRALDFFLSPRKIMNETQDETNDIFDLDKTGQTAKI